MLKNFSQFSEREDDIVKKTIKKRFGLTIGVKIASLLAFLLLSSIASLVWLSTRLFVQDNIALIQQMNTDLAASRATQVRELLQGTSKKIQLFGSIFTQSALSKRQRESVFQPFFAQNKDLLAVFVHHHAGQSSTLKDKAISPQLTEHGDRNGVIALSSLKKRSGFSQKQLALGEIQIAPSQLADNTPVFAIGLPFIQDPKDKQRFIYSLTALVDPSAIRGAFSEDDLVTTYLVEKRGRLLAHPNNTLATNLVDFSQVPIVAQLLKGSFHNGQSSYEDPKTGEMKLGSFRAVGFGGLGVVAEVSQAKAYEAADRAEHQARLLGIAILCLALLGGFLFSDSITWPITLLAKAANQIASGNFKIRLTPKSRDEVGYLSETFNEMVVGLEERDRYKTTFAKFHNKEIADKLLSGEVKLGGERMEAAIFFSDLRSFTSMSEKMTPEQVVEMLNEYMTCMVSIIRKHGGVVDKYVGDAIMAIWGVPISKEEDALGAIRACIEMRQELERLNTKRKERGEGVLLMGMGVNWGEVIAGNIGSDEKMEYTVIGDAVNLASRLESTTKSAGVDLLISESMHEKVQSQFICEKTGKIKVKGKEHPVNVFTVKGFKEQDGREVIVETPYSQYATETKPPKAA